MYIFNDKSNIFHIKNANLASLLKKILDNLGFSDLCISFHLGNGQWTAAKSLGKEINSEGFDGSPFITENGKYLIFTSSRNSPNSNSFFNHYIVRFDAEDYR